MTRVAACTWAVAIHSKVGRQLGDIVQLTAIANAPELGAEREVVEQMKARIVLRI